MNFKKLEMAGFKSFADKIEISFESGVTGIVGPNGCGKSNVADAIRWVMGEQSAKLLRGSHMQDVIFAGTEKRKSLSYCEVSLHFDNTLKIFPVDFKEVVISRKLYRSGESEYAINRSVCRLKDVADLLHDTGMGREGYSIIGQGRIDEILSAKPDDRRAIFEEAAGITKFKVRKLEAERKLLRTHDNLTRLNDIISELERQLGPLAKQAENAKIYLELKEQLKHFEVNTYLYQYDSAAAAKSLIDERLKAINEELDVKQLSYEKAVNDYTKSMSDMNSIDKTIASLRDEVLELTVGLEKMAGEYKLLQEKLNFMRQQSERLAAENAELNNVYAGAEKALAAKLGEKTASEEDIKRLKALIGESGDKYLAIVDKLTEGEGEVESNQKEIMDAMDKLSDIKSNMSRLLAEKDAHLDRRDDILKRAETLKIKITDDEIKVILLKTEADKLLKEKEKLTNKAKILTGKYNEALSLSNENNRKIDALSAQQSSVATRARMLKELNDEYDGYNNTVKNLLNAAKTDKKLAGMMEGVVAQLIKTGEKYETAIEMALSNALQNIVTRNEDDTKYIIAYLKEKRMGRATFLPIASVRPRIFDNSMRRFLSRPGCFGLACDLIKYDKKYDNIFRGLLGTTVICDNLDTAAAMARESGYGFKIVTLEGDIVNPQGSYTGGSRKADISNLLSRERELLKAEDDLRKLNAELSAAVKDKDSLNLAIESALSDIKKCDAAAHALDVSMSAENEKLNKAASIIAECKADADSLIQEEKRAAARIQEIDAEIKSVDTLENLIKGKKQVSGKEMEKRQAGFEALRKERDETHEKMTELKVSLASSESNLSAVNADITRIQNDILEICGNIEENNVQIEKNNATIRSAEAAENNARSDGDEKENAARLEVIKARLSDMDGFKTALQAALTEADVLRVRLMDEIQKLTDRKYKEESLLSKVDVDIEVLQDRIWEEYQLTYESSQEYRAEGYVVSKGLTETNKLKKQIAALGYVNVNAIEDCREVNSRYTDMAAQRDDLTRAELDLNKIIEELTKEMAEKFAKNFEQIKINFTKAFRELFGGGNAQLVLQENENLLEAGIEIIAEPPGKKLQSISLLSGGERALTAIAILFAILRLKPMPFCVLDEIEAALDDANAERFAKYLHRFSEETQFIVITHRKPTMELADSLYGVTMEEKGVSKMVSVKLSDAIKNTAAV